MSEDLVEPVSSGHYSQLKPHNLKKVVPPEKLRKVVDEMAATIREDYRDKNPLVVGVLKGCFIFMADLTRRIDIPLEIDFIRVKSYGQKGETRGELQLVKDLETDIRGRHVLLVEDIIDTGHTMAMLLELLKSRKPASLKVCALIDKGERREKVVELDYTGIAIEQGFVVGYGLDYSECYRNLDGIYEVCFT